MLNGDDDENGFNTNRYNQQKNKLHLQHTFLSSSNQQKTNLHVQHAFLCFPCCCFARLQYCFARLKRQTSKFTHYFHGKIVVCAYSIFCVLCLCPLLFFTAAHFHLAVSRKVVAKKCTRQSRKVIWDMIITLDLTTVAVEPTFFASLQHSKTYVQEGGGDSIVFELRLLTHPSCQCDVTQQRVSASRSFCRLAWDAIEERTTDGQERQNARLISLLFANLIVSVCALLLLLSVCVNLQSVLCA